MKYISPEEVLAYHKSFPKKDNETLAKFFGVSKKEIDAIIESDLTPAELLKKQVYEFFDSHPTVIDGLDFSFTNEKTKILEDAVKKLKPQITYELAEFYFNEWERANSGSKPKEVQMLLPEVNIPKRHKSTKAKVYEIVDIVRKDLTNHPSFYSMTLTDFTLKYNLPCTKSAMSILGHVHELVKFKQGRIKPKKILFRFIRSNKDVTNIDAMVNTGLSFTTIARLNEEYNLNIKIIKLNGKEKLKTLFKGYLLKKEES